ncbi:sodium:proton exchanger [Halorussus limi]|uniref:Sodium:proton exchanger n=1 Tax=Halorussus limi TaxID=2938695 RepID=A0A8U0HZ07_9EURY|nr:sodium:proton exchanger [Halorussus limi]UPV75921.1 sodium:proton exchanger [Halorussus limi]
MRFRAVEMDMSRRGVAVGVVAVALLVAVLAVPVAPALAQNGGASGGGDGGAGGIEGAIENFAAGKGLAGAILVLAAGGLLLTACVEKLISYLTRAAFGLRVSLFALAVLFTGFEFDDTVLALVLSGGGLEGAALGTALGTGLAIVGVTLAVAAIVRPFSVDLPTDYVVLFALGPVLLVPFALAGTLTFVHGLLLVGAFVLTFGYVFVREYQRDTPVFRNTELGASVRSDGGEYERGERDPRRGAERTDGGGVALPASVAEIPEDRVVAGRTGAGWLWVSLAVLALAGIVLASMLLETGSEVVVKATGIDGTLFGATVLTAILTFEDVMLTLEPVRRGVPEIGVGNVVGSVLFSVTGNVGVVVLLSDLTISRSVLTFHLPAVVVVTALAAYFLQQGRLKRWHGYLLGGCYVAYWVLALAAFGGVPVGG